MRTFSLRKTVSEDAFPQQDDASNFQGEGQDVGYDPGVAYESEATDPLQAMPLQQPVADWTATSVTVLVQP